MRNVKKRVIGLYFSDRKIWPERHTKTFWDTMHSPSFSLSRKTKFLNKMCSYTLRHSCTSVLLPKVPKSLDGESRSMFRTRLLRWPDNLWLLFMKMCEGYCKLSTFYKSFRSKDRDERNSRNCWERYIKEEFKKKKNVIFFLFKGGSHFDHLMNWKNSFKRLQKTSVGIHNK